MDAKDAYQLNGLALAFLGDAAWEIVVRQYLIEQGLTRPERLHEAAVQFVSAAAQEQAMHALSDAAVLSDVEMAIFKRGRNASPHSTAKHASLTTYKWATGFEALVGYLYLTDKARFSAVTKQALSVLEERDDG